MRDAIAPQFVVKRSVRWVNSKIFNKMPQRHYHRPELQRRRCGPIKATIPIKQPDPLAMMTGLNNMAPLALDTIQLFVKKFRQTTRRFIPQTPHKNLYQFVSSIEKNLVTEAFCCKEISFKKMHMRILPSRQSGGKKFQKTSPRVSKRTGNITVEVERRSP